MGDSSAPMEPEDELKKSLTKSNEYETCEIPTDKEVSSVDHRRSCLNRLDTFSDYIHFPKYFLLFLIGVFLWANIWFLAGDPALPGGSWFGLYFLCVFSWIGGELISLTHLPPLLGMLAVGFALSNLPVVDIANDVDPQMSSTLRNIALAIILSRAGLSLDPNKLRKHRFAFVALSFAPCLLEACAAAVAAHLLLNFSASWSFMLGFVVAGVSPAVVVPSMLICQEKRLGTNKGIPTLLIAAASLDNVTAIAAFGIVLSLTFSTSPLYLTILSGPLEVIVGIVYGAVIGTLTWFLTLKIKKRIPKVFNTVWMIFQPILFGLIGAEVKLDNIVGSTVGLGVAIILISVSFRSIVTFIVTTMASFSLRERIFITLTWIPKATVQAAIGAVALDTARQLAPGTESVVMGTEILTIAVLAILLTAPAGAVAIKLSAPRLLTRESEDP